MIPYTIVSIASFFLQNHFWRNWSIFSVLLTIYTVISSTLLLFHEHGVAFKLEYLFSPLLNWGAFWAGLPWIAFLAAAQVLMIFGGTRFFMHLTGGAYWKTA
jgi:hypothetical protein